MGKKYNKQNSGQQGGAPKKSGSSRIWRIVLAVIIVAAIGLLFAKGIISIDGSGGIHFNPGGNTNNTANVEPGGNTNNTANVEPGGNTVDPEPDGPRYYTSDVLKTLKNTEIFDDGALEHIFIGTVNASNKGSGYHYAMIKDARGKILKETLKGPDKNGIYTANVTVSGKPKEHYSSFYPDSWSPQEVVDAINEAYKNAMETGKKAGSYNVGYSRGIRIEMYIDSSSKKVVTAYPVMNGK